MEADDRESSAGSSSASAMSGRRGPWYMTSASAGPSCPSSVTPAHPHNSGNACSGSGGGSSRMRMVAHVHHCVPNGYTIPQSAVRAHLPATPTTHTTPSYCSRTARRVRNFTMRATAPRHSLSSSALPTSHDLKAEHAPGYCEELLRHYL